MKRRMILFIPFFLLLGLYHVWSQEVTGNLQGMIVNQQNEPVARVNIVITGPNLQGMKGTSTNNKGLFRFVQLPIGSYTVKISHVAFQPITFENVQIQLGKTTTLGKIILQPEVYQMEEMLVSVHQPVIDPTNTTTGANLNARALEPLPVDRNYRSIATLLPQANEGIYNDGINIAGSTGLENIYYIDGVNVTDPLVGFGGTNLPYNFIEEIQVKLGGYQAEYAGALGGVLNAVTRSGGNQFHGQVFAFFNSDRLTAERRLTDLEVGIAGSQNYDVGFGLGGPIVRDKLWFYVAYNPVFETEDIELPRFGVYQDKIIRHLFAGKLSLKPSAHTDFIFSVIGDPGYHDVVNSENPYLSSLANPEFVMRRTEEGGINYSLQGNYYPSGNLIIQGNISYLDGRETIKDRPGLTSTQPTFIDLTTGLASGGLGGFSEDKKRRKDLNLTATMFLNDHTFKTGVSFEEISQKKLLHFQTTFRFAETAYTTFGSSSDGRVFSRVPGIFFQDSWKINPRFQLNLGIRWDAQFLYDDKGELALKITDQVQPRVGLIFQPGREGFQKIYASFGRFYERIPTFLNSLQFLESDVLVLNYDHNPLENPDGADSLLLSSERPEGVLKLKGQYTDEFNLGYERIVFKNFKLGILGTYRYLGEVIEDAWNMERGAYVLGNPGRGDLSFLEPMTRRYLALEITLEKFNSRTFNFKASYVLSRNYGNYTGLADTDYGAFQPNLIPGNDLPELLVNAKGLLPNDRTHVFKFFGSYRTNFGLNVGSSFFWQSGTPLNEFGASTFGPFYSTFLKQRGTAGRTPAIWDLNLRLTYDLGVLLNHKFNPKLILDAFHVFGQRKALNYDQVHYFGIDDQGNQTAENPRYLKPLAFQEPMTVRLGIQLDF